MKIHFALIATLCLGTACAQQSAPPTELPPARKATANQAVLHVLLEREQAIKDSFRHAGTRQHPRNIFQPVRYERSLQKISAAACPQNFQIAWMDYQLAWHTHVKQVARKDLVFAVEVVGAAASGGLTAMAAIAEGAKTLTKPVEDTYTSWIKVKEEAVRRHIRFPDKYPDF